MEEKAAVSRTWLSERTLTEPLPLVHHSASLQRGAEVTPTGVSVSIHATVRVMPPLTMTSGGEVHWVPEILTSNPQILAPCGIARDPVGG